MPELSARDPGKTEGTAGEVLGHVHSVTGSQASIGLLSARGLHRAGATVGKFIKIYTGTFRRCPNARSKGEPDRSRRS